MIQSENLNELAPALIEFQKNMPKVVKDADNPFFNSKYADLASIVQAASPILAGCGLAVTQLTEADASNSGHVNLTTMLLHSSGQYMGSTFSMQPVKQDPQAYGSAITYARRYALCSILGLAPDEDDDGNAASAAPAAGPDFVWPSGKHQGERLGDMDADYLTWVCTKADKVPVGIKARAKAELERRNA